MLENGSVIISETETFPVFARLPLTNAVGMSTMERDNKKCVDKEAL